MLAVAFGIEVLRSPPEQYCVANGY